MKKIFFLFIFLTFTGTLCNAQCRHRTNCSLPSWDQISFDIYATNAPILDQNFYGFGMDMKYFLLDRFGTGAVVNMAGKRIPENFHYAIGQPTLTFSEIGWINQYNFISVGNMRINLNLTNGLAVANLADNSIKEKYWTKYGEQTRAKSIACNYYYLFEPGAEISYKVISNDHNPDFYLVAKSNYRFLCGQGKYSSASSFSDYLFAFGISMVGLK